MGSSRERCERHVNAVYLFFGEPNVDDSPSELFAVVYHVAASRPPAATDTAYCEAILAHINSIKEGARRAQLLTEHAKVFADRTTRPFPDSLIVHAYHLRYNNDIQLQQLQDKIRRLQREGGFDQFKSKMEKAMAREAEERQRKLGVAVKELVDLRAEKQRLMSELRALRDEQNSETDAGSAPVSKKRRNELASPPC